jgi:hypothetical protein
MKSSLETKHTAILIKPESQAEISVINHKIARSLAMNALGKAHKNDYLLGITVGTTSNLIYNIAVDQIITDNRNFDDIRNILLQAMMKIDTEEEILAFEKHSQPLISLQFLVTELKGGLELLTKDRSTALLVRYLVDEWKNSSNGKEHLEIAFTKLHESKLITDEMYSNLMNGTFFIDKLD